MNTRRIFTWAIDHIFGTYFALSLLIVAGGIFGAQAAMTTYDAANEAPMNLDVSITGAQTTGIVIAAPQLNGENFTFSTTTGAVLRIRFGAYREDIYATGATVNATTKKVTLVGVTRNLCPQVTKSYVSCGTGRAWGKGAIVELIQDARLFNLKANLDRVSSTKGSGAYVCGSVTQPCLGVGRYTEAQRDAFSWNTGSTLILNTTRGVFQGWDGSTWSDIEGSGGVINATETAAGKVQIGTLAHLRSLVATGSLAENVLSFKWIVKNGSGAVSAGKIPSLNQNGALSPTIGGTGTGTSFGVSSGVVLIGQGKDAMKPIYPGTAGNLLKSNGSAWTSGAATTENDIVSICTTTSTATGATSTVVFKFDTCKYTIPSGDLVAGVGYEFEASGTGVIAAGDLNDLRFYISNTTIGGDALAETSATTSWRVTGSCLGTAAAGSSVPVRCTFTTSSAVKQMSTTAIVLLPTNGQLIMEFGGRFGTSNGGNSARITMARYRKFSTTAF